MSQLADLARTFVRLKVENDWSPEEALDNFLDVLSDLEWDLSDSNIEKGGCNNYEDFYVAQMESHRKAAANILYSMMGLVTNESYPV